MEQAPDLLRVNESKAAESWEKMIAFIKRKSSREPEELSEFDEDWKQKNPKAIKISAKTGEKKEKLEGWKKVEKQQLKLKYSES